MFNIGDQIVCTCTRSCRISFTIDYINMDTKEYEGEGRFSILFHHAKLIPPKVISTKQQLEQLLCSEI